MNYGGPFIYPPISFPIPLSLFLRLLDILCPSQTLLPPSLPPPLRDLPRARSPYSGPFERTASRGSRGIKLAELLGYLLGQNARSLGSCFREFWEPIFGRVIRDIPLCVRIVCVYVRASKRSNDYERCGRERGRRMEYIYLVTSFVARNLGNLIIGGRLPSLSNCERVRTLIINLIINA